MKIKKAEEIKEFLLPFASELSLSVEDVVIKQGKDPSITVFIDKAGGVDLITCEKFHNAILEPIDELDPTFGAEYTLNVSSLGADRPFRKDEDFISHIGTRVEVKLRNSIKGKKFYDGILISYDTKTVGLKVSEKDTFTIDLKNVLKINEYIDFN
ncbi:MAG: ribosome maturation factor RimP [Clostridia bacterium]|nr:ribosome maturation factor RimP [Clostridia bacterium]